MIRLAETLGVWRRSLERGLFLAFAAAVFATVMAPPSGKGRSKVSVDLALVLALDVSGSVNEREFELQRKGLADALRHPKVLQAIARGPTKQIAVIAVQWAGFNQQVVSVPWRIIRDKASAARISDEILAMPRRFINSETHIGGIIAFGSRIAVLAPYLTSRRVIDISGDGMDNVRFATAEERDAAIRSGVTINGLAILNETPKLVAYYRHHVIGGPDSFVMKANDYVDYRAAILKKLLREIKIRFVS